MSKTELAELVGADGKSAAAAIAIARHEFPGKFFRVVRYEVQRGRAGREIPIYSASPGPDAPRPNFAGIEQRKKRQQRYYQRNRAAIIARLHAKRHGVSSQNPWLSLLPPAARRNVGNTARMLERHAQRQAE